MNDWRGVAESLPITGREALRYGQMAARSTVTDTVERVLHREPLTFGQWVQENGATSLTPRNNPGKADE